MWYEAAGTLAEKLIRAWVRVTGRTIDPAINHWLRCPIGPPGHIGQDIYTRLQEQEGLHHDPAPGLGLLTDFALLQSETFDPAKVHPEIRAFYEQTSRYHLEVWSDSNPLAKFCLWLLVTFVSRRMDQLNFPLSPLEMARGMTSEILPLNNAEEKRVYTGWLRRMVSDGRVIYAGLYSTETPPNCSAPCVKVTFPLPFGSAAVFLRPEVSENGDFFLISSGKRFGDSGFYRILETAPGRWRVRYIPSLRERFHLYMDNQAVPHCEHSVAFCGMTMLRLHYKMTAQTTPSAK